MRARGLVVVLMFATLVLGLSAQGCGGGGGGGDPPTPPSVLVVYTETLSGWSADVIAKLTAFGVFSAVDGFDAWAATPTLAQLQGYDAVLLLSTACFADGVGIGNNLADYVDGGGGVVLAGAGWDMNLCWTIAGRWLADDYLVIPRVPIAQGDGPFGMLPWNPSHAILTGVFTFASGTNATRPNGAVVPGPYDLVASWSDGTSPLIATRTIGGTRRVDLGFYPPTQDAGQASFMDPTTDAMLIVANSLRWVANDL